MVHNFLPFCGAGCSLMAGDLKEIIRHVLPTTLPSKCSTSRRIFGISMLLREQICMVGGYFRTPNPRGVG